MAQHHGADDRRANQSTWVHLAGLCLALERGAAPGSTVAALRRLAGSRDFARLRRPADPGWRTVSDAGPALGAGDADARRSFVRAWAAGVWAAWGDEHARIRALADGARAS